MQITVKLQEAFSYSILPSLILLGLIVLLTIYFIWSKKNSKKTEEKEIVIKEVKKDVNKIKEKYLKKLENLETKINEKKISIRGTYQNLSSIIRLFVYEVTNIKVQNCTLREIDKLNMPNLTRLIEEYYAPEFAEHSLGNIKSSLEKTRKVIEKWS